MFGAAAGWVLTLLGAGAYLAFLAFAARYPDLPPDDPTAPIIRLPEPWPTVRSGLHFTTITTILGLMPMVLGMNVDLINRHIGIGGPSTQYWTQLATAVAGGLAFATVLTLIVTPSLLVLGDRVSLTFKARRARRAQLQHAAA
jgi:hypothetical protein